MHHSFIHQCATVCFNLQEKKLLLLLLLSTYKNVCNLIGGNLSNYPKYSAKNVKLSAES